MPARNVLRQAKNIIYALKREYGIPMDLKYVGDADTYNLENGTITRGLFTQHIKRAVILPQKLKTDFVYDLSYIAANKNFTYGGEFQAGTRSIFIDAHDLPKDFIITNEMYLTCYNRRYEIVENTLTEEMNIWCLTVKQVMATKPESQL